MGKPWKTKWLVCVYILGCTVFQCFWLQEREPLLPGAPKPDAGLEAGILLPDQTLEKIDDKQYTIGSG